MRKLWIGLLIQPNRRLHYYCGAALSHLKDVFSLTPDPSEEIRVPNLVGCLEFEDQLLISQCNSLAGKAFSDLKVDLSILPNVAVHTDPRS